VAVAASVDYLIAGTIWPTPSKRAVHPLLGLDGLARICASVRVPVLAIGGVQHRRVAEIARTGAAGAAGIGVFLSDPGENRIGCRAASLVAAAGAMRRAFDTRGSAS
jgi:thiamine-phosphate pyrophosphorylase